MAEESKKEPKVIRVGKLIIKADEVIIQQEHKEQNNGPFHGGPIRQPNTNQPIARDFWGFPIPNSAPRDTEPQKEKE
ncbi:hypothetical protein ACFP7A_03490 [Sporolactobacillus kofuensis]|uniref:Uncharacterized protein n=1 Tax=Sporolactobacillus kofuensis TaxID=269672 RepID=A0ABW1WAV4_9BACL|nr:hypothetical protein [Sporolactobacillus kofuensis]MCO7174536.1 hypothetical protein [Sporolactobacillus kofuensis]